MTGVGRRLKAERPGVRILAVEPYPGSQLQGLRSLEEAYNPSLLDYSVLDGKILVRSVHAFRAGRLLLQQEGIFAGASSGAVLHGALRWARRMKKGKIVMLFADAGWKYLDSPLFDGSLPNEDESEELDDILWW